MLETVLGMVMTWLAAVMSDFVLPVLLLAGLAAILFFVLARKPRKGRIVIHPKDRVILYAQAKHSCPACLNPLNGLPVARCKLDPSHEIHAVCREMVKDKCPQCNGPIE